MIDSPTPEDKTFLAESPALPQGGNRLSMDPGHGPQTLAFALTDLPAGLAAWVVEKFRTWTDCDGDPENAVSRDDAGQHFPLLVHRRHRLAPSGARPCAHARSLAHPRRKDLVDVPMGYAQFPKEILHPPRSVAEKTYTDIRRWSVMDKGGHFAGAAGSARTRDHRILPSRWLETAASCTGARGYAERERSRDPFLRVAHRRCLAKMSSMIVLPPASVMRKTGSRRRRCCYCASAEDRARTRSRRPLEALPERSTIAALSCLISSRAPNKLP